MERYAVAELVYKINASLLGPTLNAVWTGATDTLMVTLAGEISASYLVPIGLRLHYDVGSLNSRVFCIQSDALKWLPEAFPPRLGDQLPPVPACNSAYIVQEMQALMGGTRADGAPVALAHLSTSDDFAASAKATATAPPSPYVGTPSRAIVFTEVLPMGSYVPPPAAIGPSPEVLSVTIPATYPQCGSEMMITSPSTGEQVKFFVPTGSQPGSQVLLVLHRA